MKQRWFALSVGIMCWTGVAWSQDPALPAPPVPAPACEVRVQDEYKKLTTDGLLSPVNAPQWGPQLTAIIHKLRTTSNKLVLKAQHADGYEQSILELAEQLRVAREETSTLRAEVEKLQAKAAPAN